MEKKGRIACGSDTLGLLVFHALAVSGCRLLMALGYTSQHSTNFFEEGRLKSNSPPHFAKSKEMAFFFLRKIKLKCLTIVKDISTVFTKFIIIWF